MKNNLICITHPQKNIIKSLVFSHGTSKIKENNFQITPENANASAFLILEANDILSFNQIKLKVESVYDIRITISLYFSNDKESWSRIGLQEETTNNKNTLLYTLPLSSAKYWQIVINAGDNSLDSWNSIKKIEGALDASFPITFKSSSKPDRLWQPENLVDTREDYGWESNSTITETADWVELQFNHFFYISSIALKSTKEINNMFPKNFSILLSKDGHNWESVASEDNIIVASNCIYRWNFEPFLSKFVRIYINKQIQSKNPKYRILELYSYAYPDNVFAQLEKSWFNDRKLASEIIPGTVQLATFNEASPFKVVQSNDPRLKQASTEYPGISQLALDGDTKQGTVVQANDSRLKLATTENPGISQLATDGDIRPNRVVQANDSRLKIATTENPGISQLATDGDTRPNKVVQANDSRLKRATTKNEGIVRLAENGVSEANVALQSNDERLRVTSTTWHGIVQLAEHNEVLAGKAVQANDPRLQEGTEEVKGRVRFAINREKTPLKAVQANDERLELATTEKTGIVLLSSLGGNLTNTVVQANDPRLSNARVALPHTHEYADKKHTFNSHEGTLNINVNKEISIGTSYAQPDSNLFPLSSVNEKGLAASFDGGIISKSELHTSILSISKQKNAIEAISKESSAAVFLSETQYALTLPNKLNSLQSSGKSLLAEGEVVLSNNVVIHNAQSIVVPFTNYSTDVFTNGDAVTIKSDGKIYKITNHQDVCIGSYTTSKTNLVLGNTTGNNKPIYIAIQGILNMRVKGKVNASDLLGYVSNIPGVLQKLHINQKDYIMAIALETSENEGEKIIKCILRR